MEVYRLPFPLALKFVVYNREIICLYLLSFVSLPCCQPVAEGITLVSSTSLEFSFQQEHRDIFMMYITVPPRNAIKGQEPTVLGTMQTSNKGNSSCSKQLAQSTRFQVRNKGLKIVNWHHNIWHLIKQSRVWNNWKFKVVIILSITRSYCPLLFFMQQSKCFSMSLTKRGNQKVL